MDFDIFIIPFTAGLIFVTGFFLIRSFIWLYCLDKNDRLLFIKGIPSFATFRAIREIFLESLLHTRIFRTNPWLGFMHMSLAFGWFMLIIAGNMEALTFRPGELHPPYYPIFFRFFEPAVHFPGAGVFLIIMDLFLLLILCGIFLAFWKRIRSKTLGMVKTSSLQVHDKIALYSLWIIFPARLFAESFTSAIAGEGGFLTGPLGNLMATFLPVNQMAYPAWWIYSLALGTFFFTLPFSRYMHIPSEILLIFLRNYGIKNKKSYSSFSDVEIHSCSRCGICLDPCPMMSAGVQTIQSVYFIRDVRQNDLQHSTVQNCLMCGKCNETCPVGIDNYALRMIKRSELNSKQGSNYDYIPQLQSMHSDIVYFGGCMGHLTPSIGRAMEKIMQVAGDKYVFLDKYESICCGRPLLLAGRDKEARTLIQFNLNLISSTGAGCLVTSCPICYKGFREEYKPGIKVMHHSEYILDLIRENRITLKKNDLNLVFHDPCELGRGSDVYDQPREVLNSFASLLESPETGKKSICCGGSLGNSIANNSERRKITLMALENLNTSNPDQIVTACPLCKKTFNQSSARPVTDIAEITANALIYTGNHMPLIQKSKIPEESATVS
jgi:Fe-S oxidoreductase